MDQQSEYSHIRIRKQGSVVTLMFVRDSGAEYLQSMVNMNRPYELLNAYCRAMFASYLLQPRPQRVLIVGLGGGAMVHFLTHYDKDVRVNVLEIDPAVAQAADRFFNVRSGGNVRVLVADGFRYLQDTDQAYDVIYMDAFLKPSEQTDATGKPLSLKTEQFYKDVQKRLSQPGAMVFNVNPHPAAEADLSAIRRVFAQSYVFRTSEKNIVVVASTAPTRETVPSLRARAKELDHRFKATFSFQDVLKNLSR